MTLLTPELLDTKTYGFEKLRYLLQSTALQEGVIDPTDLKVVQRALGANMSVDVGAGRAFVQADSGTRNGLYHEVNDAAVNVVVIASNATNPRLDQVILEIHDSSDLGSADDTPQLYVLAGTPTAGATLDNRNGAAALPSNAIRLADILVPAASSSVVTANIRDRRQWARGVNAVLTPTGRSLPTNNAYYPLTGSIRVEVGGVGALVIEGAVTMLASTGSSPNGTMIFMARSDAVNLGTEGHVVTGLGVAKPVRFSNVLAAGSHVIDTQIYYDGAALGASAVTVGGGTLNVREDLRATADNT